MSLNKKIRKVKKHFCTYCGCEYTRKTEYDSHILYCEKIHNSKYILKVEEEKNNNRIIPKKEELAIILESLVKEVKDLKETVKKQGEFIDTYIKKSKRTLNIIDWLNSPTTIQPNKDFYQTIKEYNITKKDMLTVLENGYIEGLYIIFQNIFPIDNVENHSLRCYRDNKDKFYIYIIEDDDSKWVLLRDEDFKKSLKILNRKLWIVFDDYKEENKELINKSDDVYQKFREYTSKITGSEIYYKSKSYKQILTLLYTYLKLKITNIIEYETVF
jgi:hypothetical protein